MRIEKKHLSISMQELYSLSFNAIWRQLKSEHISFWLICGYLLFEYVRPQTIYPAISFFPWSAFFAISSLASSFITKSIKLSNTSWLSKLIILYGLIVILSSMFAYDPKTSFSHLGDYFNWLLIYFAIVRIVNTPARFYIFFLLYMLFNFKMAQHGFLSWASKGFKFDKDGVGGAPGWFQNSGEFGIQLCIFTPLVISFIAAVTPYCSRLKLCFLYLAPFTAIASVIGSSSRGALIGLVLGSAWLLRTTKYLFQTIIAVSGLLVIIYLTIPPESLARLENSGSDNTSLHRLDRWHKGWETIKKYPLLGVGHKNWEEYYAAQLDYGVPGSPMVHNIFVQSGTEHGLLGAGTLACILFSMFNTTRKIRILSAKNEDNFAPYIANGMDAATIGMIISSCFVTVLYYPYVWIQAAFIMSLYTSVLNASHLESNLK